MTNTADTITYYSVVIRETLHIALIMAALYNLDFKAADMVNAYVIAPNHEKVWTALGPEFGTMLVSLP